MHGLKLMMMNIVIYRVIKNLFIVSTLNHRGLQMIGIDETRLYNCGGLPVELTLPEGEHEENWGYPFEWEIELVSELAEYEDF